jgi:hypothetical protein
MSYYSPSARSDKGARVPERDRETGCDSIKVSYLAEPGSEDIIHREQKMSIAVDGCGARLVHASREQRKTDR